MKGQPAFTFSFSRKDEDGEVDDGCIADLFAKKYNTLYNSVSYDPSELRKIHDTVDAIITFPKYASHAFTTYVISAEFGVTYLYPLLRQYQML